MSNWTKEEIDKLRQTISAKAAFDKEFRKEILANPASVIEKLAGKKIPDSFTFDVIESKPGKVTTFVLPNFYGDKLGQEELAAIAGGRHDVTAANTNVVANAEVTANAVEVTNAATSSNVAAEAEVAAVAAIVIAPAIVA
ncbi:MAG: NHLP leader peptide family RiPP precursor [Planctomycetaceae bacterium]|nr:NHLP leader peptide family RiPP precursor [Planctomycetaceae bacterium]